jgi:hypothetical protein
VKRALGTASRAYNFRGRRSAPAALDDPEVPLSRPRQSGPTASRPSCPVLGERYFDTTLGRALVETTLKWLTAYRMQLFLYAKASGNEKIGTANNWAGVDYEEAE